jgi:hypothetical protein
VIDAKTRKGILVDAAPRQDYVVVGATEAGVPLVELRETWVPHFRACRRPEKPENDHE